MKKFYIIIASVIVFLAFFSTTSAQIITGLQPGSVDPQVTLLQKILNGIGKTITTSGPGSPGQETDTFGAMTASAVKAFQCEHGIACSNSGDTANWGVVGPKTRALLNSLGASIINTFSRVSPGSQLGAVSDFDNSLVSYTTFDGDSTPGKVGNAKTFNGTSDYTDIPASSGLNSISTGVTVSAWVNFASPNTNTWQIIAGKLDKAGTNNYPYFQYMLGTDNSGSNKPRFFVTIGSDTVNDVTSSEAVAPGSWHLLTGTYDKTSLKIYVDGVLRGSLGKKTNIVFRDSPLRLGAGGAGAEFFKGAMDEVRVYNRGLTASEVAELYAAGNGGGSGGGNPPVIGACSTSLNQCTAGTFEDVTPDTCTTSVWKCKGSNGGADASCSVPLAVTPIAGVCSTTLNTCTSGDFSDATDSSTQYKWNCNGTPNGCGANVACTAPIPVTVTGVCGAAAKSYSATATFPNGAFCTTGTASPLSPANPAQGGSSTWVCKGSTAALDSQTCTATRAAVTQSTYTLTVSKTGTGTGTITSNPTGINCGSTCSKTNIAAGTSIVLTAAPATNNTVTWGGCTVSSTNANKCTVIVDASATVTAVINAPAPTPGVCGTSQGGTFTAAPTANLCSVGTASAVTNPNSGSTFAWNCTGPNGGAVVSCTANKSATVVTGVCGAAAKAYSSTATFPSGAYCSAGTANPASPTNPIGGSSTTWVCNGTTPANDSPTCTATRAVTTQNVITLTVNRDGTGAGTVTGSPAITCGSSSACTATSSTSVAYTLNASANSGSTFVGWSGGGCSGVGTCTVTASTNTTVTATFNTPVQVGTELISSERRTTWNYAGVKGGIPTDRPDCTTAACNTLYSGPNSGSVTAATINAAINSAPDGSVVRIPAGDFSINGGINIRKPVTLRGMGASTVLNFSSTNGSGWNYDPNYINIENAAATDADADIPSMGGAFNVRAWNGTNGVSGTYSHGATVLDLASTSGINEGDTITMWQDDPADSAVPYSPDMPNIQTLSAPENYIVSAKNIGDNNSNNISMQGSSQTKRTGQQQRARVNKVLSSTQVEIDAPGIYRPTGTWKTAFNPKVGLQKTIDGVGLENFQFKRTNGGGLVRSLIGFNKATNSWMTGVSISGMPPSGKLTDKSTDVALNLTDSRNVTIRNNWFTDLRSGGVYTTTTYGVSMYQCSGCVVENNIFNQVESPIEVNSGTTGSVIAYNYENHASFAESGIQAHEEGSAVNLFEGNTVFNFWADTFHGNTTLNTIFRNYFYGDRGIDLMAYHRWYNIIGNVVGSKIVAYKSVYSVSPRYDRWANSGAGGVGFRLGYASADARGDSSNCYNPDFSTEKLCADPWVAPSTMIWGNYVEGKSPATGTWDTSEVTPGEKLFPNDLPPDANSATHSLPDSLYLSYQPSWWNLAAGTWPPIGPGITAGSMASNHVIKIPAQRCYEAAGSPSSFSNSVSACSYLTASTGGGGGTTGDTTAPTVSLTAPAAGTVSGTITLSATASDDTGVTSVQFKVDGAVSGSADTSLPYSVSLNTTTLTNGAHTITATASDAAGNQTTSGSVSVTVSNTTGTPPSTTFAVGASVQVQGANVNTRSTPSLTGASAGYHNTGDVGTVRSITSGTYVQGIYAEGHSWWKINFALGADGWVAEDYLRPATVGSASAKFAVNDRVRVTNADVNARDAAGTTGTNINGLHQIGDLGSILGGGILADALYWWNVNFDTGAGADGWVAENYLATTTSGTGGGTGDTTAPAVSLTAPAAGTVSGTITLSATASDNVGVVAVQFRVDGVNSGNADTSSPYSVSLDTTNLSNGTHTITAVAGDAAGNQTTSSGVSVTVSNGTGGGGGGGTGAGTITVDCSNSAITSALASSTITTVMVKANTGCDIGTVSLSGKQLIGAGKGANGTVVSAGKVSITKSPNAVTRVSGFRFTGNSTHVSVGGAPSARAFIIDNNYLFSNGADFLTIGSNGGVIHHNDFVMPITPDTAGADVLAIQPNETWGDVSGWPGSGATTMGTADTLGIIVNNVNQGGERNIYLEDNTFTNVLETAPDGDTGARLVIRNNTYNDSSIVFHSGQPNDTSPDGTRQFEIYGNTFNRITKNNNLSKYIWVRGGSGVIANNTFHKIDTGTYGGNSLKFGVGCPVGYPVKHQIGQTVAPSGNNGVTPTQPLLVFGNTDDGVTGTLTANWIALGGTGDGISCGNPENYVQDGRDFYFNNSSSQPVVGTNSAGVKVSAPWVWTPYTYPHPLVANPK